MDFGEALQIVKNGGKVRRPLWSELGGQIGDWLEITSGVTPDGRIIQAVPMIWNDSEKAFNPWGGARYDILKDDWEEVQ